MISGLWACSGGVFCGAARLVSRVVDLVGFLSALLFCCLSCCLMCVCCGLFGLSICCGFRVCFVCDMVYSVFAVTLQLVWFLL